MTGGPGDDTISGGAVRMRSTTPTTLPVTVTLRPQARGAAGEHDTIASDVEDATGGSGNDAITAPAATTTSSAARKRHDLRRQRGR